MNRGSEPSTLDTRAPRMVHGTSASGLTALVLAAWVTLAGCAGNGADTAKGAADADGDGFDGFQAGGSDCDDNNAAVNPVAAEICDGIDNDCDFSVDESDAEDAATFFADADDDGFGADRYPRLACAAPIGFVDVGGDCNDRDPFVHPGAAEVCDAVDSDCDGDFEDAESRSTFWTDDDADGYGNPDLIVEACVQPEGTATNGTDCDDGDGSSNPGAVETWYDGVDQACDGGDDYDADGDGEQATAFGGTDCNDTDDDVNAAAIEVCNGVDDNCDGLTDPGTAVDATVYYRDVDRDGYGLEDQPISACNRPTGYALLVGDCDDNNSAARPNATETWYDGVDQDCDGESDYDADMDGFDALELGGLDCDDTDAAVGRAESWWPDPDGDGYGDRSEDVTLECDGLGPSGSVDNGGDCDESDVTINIGGEEIVYDGIDQNCDGADRTDADRDGFASVDEGGTDCDDDDPRVHPYAWEVPGNSIDDDCDGDTDGDDTDTATALTLGDDDFVAIAFTDHTFRFCGLNRTTAYVSSNGRITFGTGSIRSTPSASAHGLDDAIAGYWTDLDPRAGGTISWMELDDAVLVRFEDVPRFGTTDGVSFTIAMLADGTATVDVDAAPAAVALTGWSCGTGRTTSLDLSVEMDTYPDSAAGLGQGTEGAVYELWDGVSTLTDVEGLALRFCATTGTDADNDGWSDNCGDPDDTAVTITPR